ncbi:amidase [Pseudothermotoga thermarum]|nr:amidase [Pseudothermotoga thermarum]
MTITEAIRMISKRKVGIVELVNLCLENIHKNQDLNAFITCMEEQALEEAKEKEKVAKNADFEKQPLLGIPIAVKDLIDVKGVPTTAGSLFFKENIAKEDAFVVKLLRKAGAIIVGKTNLHEIALGVTNNNPHFGPCRNPYDKSKISGGSSGGSAVAVATGMALAALGTDTGGSIRIPAALCGVVGLKPTYGVVSTSGVIPLAWHLDHVGPITSSVEDAHLIFRITRKYDRNNPYSVTRVYKVKRNLSRLRVAVAVGEYIEEADQRILELVRDIAKSLEKMGFSVEQKKLDWLKDLAAANVLMTQVEAATFHKERLLKNPEMFGSDVRERLMQGLNTSGTDYALARKTQTEAKHIFREFFKEYDLILLPTTPITAPPIEGENAVAMARKLTRFTAPFNISGLPALTVPVGFVDGLPAGVQLVASWFEEELLFFVGQKIESIVK